MQIVFFGAGDFAALFLQRLSKVHDITLTVTPPPRPTGRKIKKRQCPVAACALRLNLPLYETTAPADVPAAYAKPPPELVIVCDYGRLVPPSILTWAPMGALNLHPSLLPRWRGAAPIERAILAGDSETGVTVIQMNEELDAGDIIRQQKIPISPDATGGALSETLAEAGAALMLKVLNNWDAISSRPQPAEGVSYAAKISAAERVLDFNQSSDFVAGQIRAFYPSPGAHTYIKGVIVKAHLAVESDLSGVAGDILAVGKNGITIACAKRAITLLRLQRAGRQTLCAEEFLRGFPLSVGEKAGIIKEGLI